MGNGQSTNQMKQWNAEMSKLEIVEKFLDKAYDDFIKKGDVTGPVPTWLLKQHGIMLKEMKSLRLKMLDK